MVWSHAAVGTIMATAFAVLMAYQFGDVASTYLIRAWVTAKVVVALIRVGQAQAFRRNGYAAGRHWRLWTYYLLAVDGLIWGVCGFWLTGADRTTAALAI